MLAQSYTPFGNPLERVGSGQSNFGYTGQQVDSTGLVYLRARYYDSLTGRFISQNPFADPTLGNVAPPIFAFPLDKGNLRWQTLIAPSQFNSYSAITDLAKTRITNAHLPPAEPKLNRQWR
jgi:RHS repeat-associated protein